MIIITDGNSIAYQVDVTACQGDRDNRVQLRAELIDDPKYPEILLAFSRDGATLAEFLVDCENSGEAIEGMAALFAMFAQLMLIDSC